MVSVKEPPGVRRTRVGLDQPNWAAIFADHYQVMHAAAASVLKGQTALGVDADDIVSIALNEAIRRGIPANIQQLHSYLARIARLRAIDALRRRKHQADEPPDPTREALRRIEEDGPDELVVQSELASEITAHLNTLPERERFALESTVMRDRPRDEVAAALGVTPQRVSQLVNAALHRLRELPAFADGPPFDTGKSGGSIPPAGEARP